VHNIGRRASFILAIFMVNQTNLQHNDGSEKRNFSKLNLFLSQFSDYKYI